MKKQAVKNSLLKRSLILIIIAAVIGLSVSIIKFSEISSRKTATATIAFTFAGSADGKTPAGSEFDIKQMLDDAVIEKGIELAQLTGKYDTAQVRKALSLRGEYPENIARQLVSYESLLDFSGSRSLSLDGYHATLYYITLNNSFDSKIPGADLAGILDGIMTAYKSDFREKTGLKWTGDLLNLDAYDYSQQLDVLNERITQAAGYAAEMYELEQGAVIGGAGFNDIYIRLNSLADSEIPRLRAIVTMDGLTKDTDRLLTQYRYEIDELNNQLKHYKVRLERVEKLLDSYDKNEIIYISSGESLTKIDGNSSQTYDILVAERVEISEQITSINTEIAGYELKIKDIMGEEEPLPDTPDDENGEDQEETQEDSHLMEGAADDTYSVTTTGMTALERSISDLIANVKSIEDDFNAMLTSFSERQVNDATTLVSEATVQSGSILSGTFIKFSIKTAGPFVTVALIIVFCMVIARRKKEMKNA